jgi:hypothetical protein
MHIGADAGELEAVRPERSPRAIASLMRRLAEAV